MVDIDDMTDDGVERELEALELGGFLLDSSSEPWEPDWDDDDDGVL